MARSLGLVFVALVSIGSASTGSKHEDKHSEAHAAAPGPLPTSGERPDAYLRRFVGQWLPHVQDVHDDQQWRDVMAKHYTNSYQQYLQHWQHLEDATSDAPERASDCSDLDCLKRWKRAQLAQIREFVPEVYQSRAEGSVQHSFQRFADRLKQEAQQPSNASHPAATELAASAPFEDLPELRQVNGWLAQVHNGSEVKEWWEKFVGQHQAMVRDFEEDTKRLQKEFPNSPPSAEACKTVGELKEWRDGQLARIRSFVPKVFQGFASDSVDSEFRSNKQRIERQAASKAHEASGNETPRAAELAAGLPALPAAGAAENPLDDFVKQWVPHEHGHERMSSPASVINHFAGRWVPKVHNSSDRHEWQEKFMSRYGEASRDYAGLEERLQQQFPDTPQDAHNCHSVAALKQWRKAQNARVAAFVPKTWQKMAEEAVQREFTANEARIAKEQKQEQEGTNVTSSAAQGVAMVAEAEAPAAAEASMKDFVKQWIPSPSRQAPEWVPGVAKGSEGQDSPLWGLGKEAVHSPKWYADHVAGKTAAWRESFLARYDEAWRRYKDEAEKMQHKYSGAPKHASEAETVRELEAWKAAQLARIYAFVPPAFRRAATDALAEVSQKHLARIQSQTRAQQHSGESKADANAHSESHTNSKGDAHSQSHDNSKGDAHSHSKSDDNSKSSAKAPPTEALGDETSLASAAWATPALVLGAAAAVATAVAFVGSRGRRSQPEDGDVYVQV